MEEGEREREKGRNFVYVSGLKKVGDEKGLRRDLNEINNRLD